MCLISSVYAETTPTTLLTNTFLFSTEAYIYDNVDDSIPATNPFPEESSYTTYQSWYAALEAPGPGTINIVTAGDLVSGEWEGDSFDNLDPRVVRDTKGIPLPNGFYADGFAWDGISHESEPNVWTEVRLQDRTFGDMIFLNNDNSYSYVRYYRDLNLQTPINPGSLGLNVESNAGVSFYSIDNSANDVHRLFIGGNTRRVGVGTSSPQEALHVADGDIRFTGSLYGKLGEFYTYKNESDVTLDQSSVDVWKDMLGGTASTLEVTSVEHGNAVIMFGMVSATYSDGNNKDDAKMEVEFYVTATGQTTGTISNTSCPSTHGDMDVYWNEKAGFRVFHVYKNDQSENVDVAIQLRAKKIKGAHHDLADDITLEAGKSSVGVFVIPYVD